MKYWKVECSNGFCGCDETWLMESEDDYNLTAEDVIGCYSYESGAAGINPDDPEFDPESEEFEGETYEDLIYDNLMYEEISKEEFETLKNEELWEVR